MDIFNNSGELILSVEIDEKTFLKKSVMGDDYIQSVFTIDNHINVNIGSYIFFNSNKYKVNTTPSIAKKSNVEYEYNIIFESVKYDLSKILFKLDTDNTEFFLNADIGQIQSTIIDLMNSQGLGTWVVGSTSITSFIDFDFSNENCLQVLNRACDEFSVEYEIVTNESGNLVLNIRDFIGTVKNISLSYKKGLYSLSQTKLDDRDVITRLFAKGGSNNIPSSYDSDRIKIDPIELNISEYGVNEASIIYDEIYPKFEGSVDSFSNYTFIDSSIDFNINDQLISGITAKVNFLNGDLAGYTFEISTFNNSTKQITLIPIVNDIGVTLPDSSNEIGIDSSYVFLDIYMPDYYVESAESDLLIAANEYITKYNEPLLKYDVNIDERYMRSNDLDLFVGDQITIKDSQMTLSSLLRIYSIKQLLVDTYNYQIELTDSLKTNRLIDITNKQYSTERAIEQLKKDLRILKNN